MPNERRTTLAVASLGQYPEERSGPELQQTNAYHMAVNAGTNHYDAQMPLLSPVLTGQRLATWEETAWRSEMPPLLR
jgi:hypothetical protein